MRQAAVIAVHAALLALNLFCLGVRPAGAEPSETCRGIAARFASAPGELDARSLAVLVLCASAELGERMGIGGATPPPTVQAEPAPAPAAEPPAVPPPQRMYGEWPQPSPWGESWPKSSWDQ
jgi:hypothetical protein